MENNKNGYKKGGNTICAHPQSKMVNLPERSAETKNMQLETLNKFQYDQIRNAKKKQTKSSI